MTTVFFIKVWGKAEETAENLKVTSKAHCVLYQVKAVARERADDINTPIKNVWLYISLQYKENVLVQYAHWTHAVMPCKHFLTWE